MAIPSFNGPRGGSFTTSEILPLDGCLSFTNLLKACFLSYFEFGFTASTSKNETFMVVIIVWGFMKCKFQVAFWYPSCNPP